MNIAIHSVPQQRIRANQIGDWWSFGGGSFTIHALETLSPESQFAVIIHELVEAYLCRKRGVTDEVVSAFDEHYEAECKEGKHKPDDEPGDDLRSPYRTEHMAATFVERAVCHVLGISWPEHLPLEPALARDHQKT